MKKNIIYLVLIITSTILITLIFSGCQPQQRPLPPDNNLGYNNTNPQGINNDNNNANNNANNNLNNNQELRRIPINVTDNSMVNELVTRSNRIANRIENIDIVDRARVIVTTSQRTALVGLDLEDDVEAQVTDDLRRRIRSIITDTDKRIKNILITADTQMYDEIDSIVRELNRGRSYSDFVDDIDSIQKRMAPIT